jgi:hypothetical protein
MINGLLLTSIGCESPTPPADKSKPSDSPTTSAAPANPHDVPLTEEEIAKLRSDVSKYPDAAARIESYRETIVTETKGGLPENPFKAHRALDELDRVLEWLPEIASQSGVAKENWEAVTISSQELRELFNKVHTNIDNKQPPDYASVASGIDERIAKLKGFVSGK